jgi:hypothetical protein
MRDEMTRCGFCGTVFTLFNEEGRPPGEVERQLPHGERKVDRRGQLLEHLPMRQDDARAIS